MANINEHSKEETTATIDRVATHDVAIDDKDILADAAARGQATSGYEALTPWETVKTFKWATAACFAAAFSAATDGYQIGSVAIPTNLKSDS